MNLADFNLALTNRLTGDTGSGGLRNSSSPLITAVYPNVAPPLTNFPYVIIVPVQAPSSNAFSRDVIEVRFRTMVYAEKSSHTVSDMQQRVSDIIKRLYGNWSSSAPSTQPTYGLHRWQMSLTSPWVGSYVTYVDAIDNSDDYFFQMGMEWKTTISN